MKIVKIIMTIKKNNIGKNQNFVSQVMQVSCPGSSFEFENIWEDGPVYARSIY